MGLWSVQYDSPEIHHDDGSRTVNRVVITGYDVAPRLLADALAPFGYTFGADAEAGVGALVAAPERGMPGAVIMPLEGGSALLISHGSSSSELVSLLPDLDAVPASSWIAATAAATKN